MTRNPIRVRATRPGKNARDKVYGAFLKGLLRIFILHRAEHGPVHGGTLLKAYRRLGSPLSAGTLYPVLHALEREQLLSSRTRLIRGRLHRLYTLTRQGRASLSLMRQSLGAIVGDIVGLPETTTGDGRPALPPRSSGKPSCGSSVVG